jgi:N6-L-threonylcarbamoyladenine synthase
VRASDGGLCLGVETSCDETAAAVVGRDGTVYSNVVSSQAALHARYGGVVPEVAARRHLEAVLPAVDAALREAGARWEDITLVAVTRGPGLPAALLVGLAAAKALAFARGLTLVGVNHLAGHVWAHVLRPASAGAAGEPVGQGLPRPAVCLVVSGSHTDLCLLPAEGGMRLLGTTVDDAAGEAFDKVARLLGLGYPGGPAIERAARAGDPAAVAFPRVLGPVAGPRHSPPGLVGGRWAFSFSGLKTAVALHLRSERPASAADVAAAFQAAVVESLVAKTVDAALAHGARTVLVAGGVAANGQLRAEMGRACAAHGLELRVPPLAYCTDNAAMIAAAGWAAFEAGRRDGWDLDADPDLPLQL